MASGFSVSLPEELGEISCGLRLRLPGRLFSSARYCLQPSPAVSLYASAGAKTVILVTPDSDLRGYGIRCLRVPALPWERARKDLHTLGTIFHTDPPQSCRVSR